MLSGMLMFVVCDKDDSEPRHNFAMTKKLTRRIHILPPSEPCDSHCPA